MVDYLEEGRTINGAYYAKELRRLRQEILKKRRGKLTRVFFFALARQGTSLHLSSHYCCCD